MGVYDRLRALFNPPAVPAAGVDANPLASAQLQNTMRNYAADPARQNFWSARRTYSDYESEHLGRNGLVRRCLSLRPFDATRAGWARRFSEIDADEAAKLNAELTTEEGRLDVSAKLRLALMRSEQYGHSIVLVGVDDGSADLSVPLDMSKATRVLWLKVFDRTQYTIGELSPPTSENFGFPETYLINDLYEPEVKAFAEGQRLTAPSKVVHYTRILGPFYTEDGHSRLDEIGTAFEDYLATQTAGAQIVDTFSVGVFKITNWLAKLTQDSLAARGRISLIQAAKSLVNAVVLDRETEEFDYVNRSIAGLPDLIDGKGAMLSAFTGIPPMLILGADPKGFSTGAEIIKAYNTTVQAWQVDKLEEPLQRLTKILLAVLDREVGDFTIHFHPLRTPDPKEVAELRAAIWGAARMLAEKGLITRDEFRALLRDPTDPAPTIQLSEEGSAVEASALQVGQVQALQNLILAAYPEGADPDVYRAAVEGALPQLSALVMRLFPDPPAADEETDEASERWVSAEEVANEFGSVTKGQLKRVRASAPKVEEPGRLTWTRPGSKPLYRLSEVRAMFDVAGPDLTVGTADDPGPSLHKEDNADDPDPSLADPR